MLEKIFGEKDDTDTTLKQLNKIINRLAVVKDDCNNAIHNGDSESKDRYVTKIIELYDDLISLSMDYMKLLADQGDPQRGINELENLREIIQSTETFFESSVYDDVKTQNFVNVEVYNAIFLFQAEKFRRCLKSCDAILESDSARDGIWVLRGQTLVELGKNYDALEAFETAIGIKWHNADAWVGKGQILMALEKYPEALEAFDTAIEIDEGNADAYIGKTSAHSGLGDEDSAIQTIDLAYDLLPDDPKICLLKSLSSIDRKRENETDVVFQNRLNEGARILERMISENEENAALWYLKSKSQEILGDNQKSQLSKKRAIRLDPNVENDPLVQAYFEMIDDSENSGVKKIPKKKTESQNIPESSNDSQQKNEKNLNAPKKVFVKPQRQKETIKTNGFASVAGMLELKALLTKDVIKPLKNPDKYKKFNVTIPNGILLFGPPGCGKTFIVEKLAEEVGYNFQVVPPSRIGSKYIHETSDNIAKIFTEAKNQAPTILFFDEFEALVPKRESLGSEGQFKNEEINEFLTHLNNASKMGILVVGATNKPDLIDSAVMRAGRMDKIILVPPPDFEARKELFSSRLSKVPHSTDMDFEKLAEKTEYYSSVDITTIIEAAGRIAGDQDLDEINQDLMEHVIENSKPSISKSQIESFNAFSHLERK